MTNYTELRKEYPAEWRIWYRMCNVCAKNRQYYVETDVCEEWKGAQGFVNWLDDVGPKPFADAVLDRINKFGDYELGNVEWTTKTKSSWRSRAHDTEEQLRWRRIAVERGINRHTFYGRVQRGWSLEDAATMEPHNKPYKTRKA
jgi:hypothetical protein